MTYKQLISDTEGKEWYVTYDCRKCGTVFDPSTWKKITQEGNRIYMHCPNPKCDYQCEVYTKRIENGPSFLIPFPNCLEICTVEAKDPKEKIEGQNFSKGPM